MTIKNNDILRLKPEIINSVTVTQIMVSIGIAKQIMSSIIHVIAGCSLCTVRGTRL